MDGFKTILLIASGLFLFLYALTKLSDGLRDVISEKMKRVLGHFTNHLYKSILTGMGATMLLDSSSAVIIMTIALVNAHTMTFRQAMGVVMGANIGTTLSSQIFALNVSEYCAVPVGVGFLLMILHKRKVYRDIGAVIFSFGLIFFGLFTMEEA